MAIPPFPPQDLAKLVLGYLAEEELMTAYDEFLQASPYLDAYKNEYDRILMTSLRSILADYRAVKIYIESCKPHSLRKKLLQCYSILEMVKYLITVVDIQKLPIQDNIDRHSLTKNNVTTRISCDVCLAMKLKTCVCKNKSILAASQLLSTEEDKHTLPRSLDISAESQHLSHEEDKHTLSRFLEATSLADLPGNSSISKKAPGREIKNNNLEQSKWCTLTNNNNIIDISDENVCVQPNPNQSNRTKKSVLDSRQKIEEFNTILNLVCNKNVTNEKLCDNLVSNRVSSVTTFQDFTSGVQGTNHDKIKRVPDSSTTDTIKCIPLLPKPKGAITKPIIKHLHDKEQKCENKIKILSDVRFDKGISYETPPAVIKSTVTSSTVVPNTKRILINGTPGFIQKSELKTCNFSREEIMAMPTLILLPASGKGSTYNLDANSSDSKVDMCKINTTASSSLCKYEPLFVDVTSSMPSQAVTDILKKDVGEGSNTVNEVGLIKTVDPVTHASAAKNSTESNKSSTPQILPPLRSKSSSTPRRNSHIRVLDFNTPRRILDEAIIEKDSNDDVVVINSSVGMTPRSDSNVVKDFNTNVEGMKPIIEKNWDENLRALVNPDLSPPSSPKITKKKKRKNKKLSMDGEKCDKSMKVKKQSKDIDETQSIPKKELPIKAKIKIISAEESGCHSETENDQCINNRNEEVFDTPENERLSLQNEIGVKFNICDLLETPYKQAIYDIQMDTPRFLGPDLPGEPLSDIKITNIPTPRFFDTPKQPQATPSYSSRPTDYSSGSSYYKPDDQDCPVPDISVSKNNEYSKTQELTPIDPKKEISEAKCTPKSRSRPIRKCAKNVSYTHSSIVIKSDNDVASEEVTTVTVKSQTTDTKKSVNRRPSKSKSTKSEKHKSPFKRDVTKNFMKIKPRRVTPIKETKKRKTLSDLRLDAKKKTAIKENHLKVSSLAVMPSKSRRKSSTPRKLHRGKMFNSSTSSNTSPNTPETAINKTSDVCTDNRVSIKSFCKDREASETPTKEGEESISKIKEFIESMSDKKITTSDEYVNTKSFHNVLVKRGLDIETARIIERDLLDTPPLQDGAVQSTSNDIVEENTVEKVAHDCLKPDFNANKQITPNTHESDDEVEDMEFSVKDCNEDTNNFFVCSFDESTFIPKELISLKDKFCMEVCIDDGVILRLKATDFNELFNEEPTTVYDKNEINAAVTSISNIDTLYTPIKDRRAQYYEIFDSTLTSIDTPLKENSSKKKEHEESVAEMVIDVENITAKKRKRVQSGQDESISTKKTKVDPPYLLNHANIQNMDIESVLSKLHGP